MDGLVKFLGYNYILYSSLKVFNNQLIIRIL